MIRPYLNTPAQLRRPAPPFMRLVVSGSTVCLLAYVASISLMAGLATAILGLIALAYGAKVGKRDGAQLTVDWAVDTMAKYMTSCARATGQDPDFVEMAGVCSDLLRQRISPSVLIVEREIQFEHAGKPWTVDLHSDNTVTIWSGVRTVPITVGSWIDGARLVTARLIPLELHDAVSTRLRSTGLPEPTRDEH